MNVVIQCFKMLTENVKTSPVLKSKNLSRELLFLSTVLKNRWVPVVDTTSQFCRASKHIMVLLILYSVVVWREVNTLLSKCNEMTSDTIQRNVIYVFLSFILSWRCLITISPYSTDVNLKGEAFWRKTLLLALLIFRKSLPPRWRLKRTPPSRTEVVT